MCASSTEEISVVFKYCKGFVIQKQNSRREGWLVSTMTAQERAENPGTTVGAVCTTQNTQRTELIFMFEKNVLVFFVSNVRKHCFFCDSNPVCVDSFDFIRDVTKAFGNDDQTFPKKVEFWYSFRCKS